MSSKKTAAPGSDLNLISLMQRFATEETARDLLESIRWPEGPICAHCGVCGNSTKLQGKAHRAGLYQCGDCGKQYTVTVGTIFEDSHIPLNKWLIAFYMMCASKTQISALQLQRQLELGSYRTAWHMCHRIRFAMADLAPVGKLSGEVEADETYIGGKARGKGRGYVGNKMAVVSLVERGGRVRSTVMKEKHVSSASVGELLKEHVATAAHLNTDESPIYTESGKVFASHETVCHKKEEYARTDTVSGRVVTTNAAEGYFGNSKRSLDGTHHHVGKSHLPLYIAELDYKYNTRKVTDGERTVEGIGRVEGKRLTLRPLKKATRSGILV